MEYCQFLPHWPSSIPQAQSCSWRGLQTLKIEVYNTGFSPFPPPSHPHILVFLLDSLAQCLTLSLPGQDPDFHWVSDLSPLPTAADPGPSCSSL